MQKQKTLVLLKPDVLQRNLVGKVLSIYEENDLKIVKMKMMDPTLEVAKAHYAEHEGREYYDRLIEYITSDTIVALILEGENAIEKVRELNGPFDISKAKEGTIRKMYAISNNINCVHASDSLENAEREMNIWFKN
ncbi:MAG: nucleoside-diphosphate kinase [Clostridium butyricum]|nr:nucleoside-diphosphate kinase [Clostridium butyricum]